MCPLFRAQIYDDSTAADSTQRTDGGDRRGGQTGGEQAGTVFNFILCCVACENDHVETQNFSSSCLK